MSDQAIVESEYRWLDDDGPAFGGPGLEPRWTSSQKDAVTTAYAASSRVWFTVSHGTLNEVYFPTIDRPQMRDMELLFTDEQTFFHEENAISSTTSIMSIRTRPPSASPPPTSTAAIPLPRSSSPTPTIRSFS